jgi:hypothetical protein
MSRSWPDPKAQELLAEICQTAAQRMNTGTNIADGEAFTLGRISGIATRYPGVMDAWKALEAEAQT